MIFKLIMWKRKIKSNEKFINKIKSEMNYEFYCSYKFIDIIIFRYVFVKKLLESTGHFILKLHFLFYCHFLKFSEIPQFFIPTTG